MNIQWKIDKFVYKLSHRIEKVYDIVTGVDFDMDVPAENERKTKVFDNDG